MEEIIGIITNLNGDIIKKDIENGIETPLHEGDLVYLNDNIWSRSLDARALVKLKNAEARFKPGTRIKFDKEYLEMIDSYDFIEEDELVKFGINLYQPKNEITPQILPEPEELPDNGELSMEIEAEIYVGPIIGSLHISPIVQDGMSVYECRFGDIKINVKTMPERQVVLYDVNLINKIATSIVDENGDCIFELKAVQENTKYDFFVLIYEENEEIFKQKIRLDIGEINSQAEFAPIDVANFDLARNIDKEGIEFVDAISIVIDAMKKREEDYPISKVLYGNETNPVFSFSSRHDFEAKFYLVGINEYIFDEMVELNGVIKEIGDKMHFVCTNNFKVSGKYTFYANFISKEKGKSPHEFFFDLIMKFDNSTDFKDVKCENGIITGKVINKISNIASSTQPVFDIVLYGMDNFNEFSEIASTKSNEQGNFVIDLKNITISTKRVVLRNIDAYGNKSIAIGVELNN